MLNDLLKTERVISLNETITIYNNLQLDCLYGIFSNTNDFFNFIVTEIEYEDYDNLRNFISLNERKVSQVSKVTQINNIPINAFLIQKNEVQVDIIKNNFENPVLLPKHNKKFISNNFISYNCNKYKELGLNYFTNNYDNLKKHIVNNSTIFLVKPNHSGMNYLLKNICDELGINYILKDTNKFSSMQQLVTYLKKCEFKTPCLINFKNSKKISEMINSNNSQNNINGLDETKNILNMKRNEFDQHKLSFIFSFENSTDIDKNLNVLSDVIIEQNLPDINQRIDLIKTGFYNILNYPDKIFSNNFGMKLEKLFIKLNLKDVIENLNLFEISKMTVGYDIKEIKSFLKLLFEEYYTYNKILLKQIDDANTELSPNQSFNPLVKFDVGFIKKTFNQLKKSRLKSEKTISSIPEVKWEDVGGLETAKEDINDTIQLPLKYPKLFENSLKRRSGLLLYGPPGSGKTLLAKAIANECTMNFISVKGPELLNMYVGESEKNIREVFERARSNRPCALFFDEIDALAPARTKNSDQNNVMDRIVAQFMTEMDGLTKENDLIVIASTNRPDLVDPSLLRPGRFDKMIYVGLPKTVEEKIKIYQAQTLKLKLAEDVEFRALAEMSSQDYSGADIYAVCCLAFTILLKEHLSRDRENGQVMPTVGMSHFREAINRISPSLPAEEIKKYEELRKKYE